MSKSRKKIWSDLHIGHANSIKFDNRPFRDLDHMHTVLANNYNSTMSDGDICYFVGDIGYTKNDVLKNWIKRLNPNTTKILILGNHDQGSDKYYDMGFDLVCNGIVEWIAGQRVTISHCPLIGIQREDTSQMKNVKPEDHWHGEWKNKSRFSFHNHDQIHLHGHIHSPNKGKSQKILYKQYDIGVPANGYKPIPFSVLESWIVKNFKKK